MTVHKYVTATAEQNNSNKKYDLQSVTRTPSCWLLEGSRVDRGRGRRVGGDRLVGYDELRLSIMSNAQSEKPSTMN